MFLILFSTSTDLVHPPWPPGSDACHEPDMAEQIILFFFRLCTGHSRLRYHLFNKYKICLPSMCTCGTRRRSQSIFHVSAQHATNRENKCGQHITYQSSKKCHMGMSTKSSCSPFTTEIYQFTSEIYQRSHCLIFFFFLEFAPFVCTSSTFQGLSFSFLFSYLMCVLPQPSAVLYTQHLTTLRLSCSALFQSACYNLENGVFIVQKY